MPMTMTQKILAAHAGLDSVVSGQLIEAKLDIVLGNDITAPVAIKEFEKASNIQIKQKNLKIQQVRLIQVLQSLKNYKQNKRNLKQR